MERRSGLPCCTRTDFVNFLDNRTEYMIRIQ